MEWLIDIIKEWVLGLGYLTTGFVDRGDPVAVDFVLGDLTTDGAWHDLDLSGIIPAGAKAVSISVIFLNSLTNKVVLFRTDGNVNSVNVSLVNSQIALILFGADPVIPLPISRIIEYNITAGGWMYFIVTVKGWWF